MQDKKVVKTNGINSSLFGVNLYDNLFHSFLIGRIWRTDLCVLYQSCYHAASLKAVITLAINMFILRQWLLQGQRNRLSLLPTWRLSRLIKKCGAYC